MSILIKGMAMPKCCDECSFYDGDTYGICDVVGLIMLRESKYSYCPLVELPPHGDLIDRDVLEPDTDWWYGEDGFTAYSRRQIEDAPIVVESEE